MSVVTKTNWSRADRHSTQFFWVQSATQLFASALKLKRNLNSLIAQIFGFSERQYRRVESAVARL